MKLGLRTRHSVIVVPQYTAPTLPPCSSPSRIIVSLLYALCYTDVQLLPSPFITPQVETDDHCETSPRAYDDIAPLLTLLARNLGKAPQDLAVYDPYFCAGGTKLHLAKLGFPNVYNECEDFYAVIDGKRVPEHDVIVTNPPYSGDHVKRLLRYYHPACIMAYPTNFNPSIILAAWILLPLSALHSDVWTGFLSPEACMYVLRCSIAFDLGRDVLDCQVLPEEPEALPSAAARLLCNKHRLPEVDAASPVYRRQHAVPVPSGAIPVLDPHWAAPGHQYQRPP